MVKIAQEAFVVEFIKDIRKKDPGIGGNIQSKKEDTTQQQPVNTTAFCPLCGAKVRVGVVLIG